MKQVFSVHTTIHVFLNAFVLILLSKGNDSFLLGALSFVAVQGFSSWPMLGSIQSQEILVVRKAKHTVFP